MYIPDLRTYLLVVVLLCCRMYIPDLPTYLVFYLETTCGSFIDPPPPPTMTTTMTTTHLKSFYIPEEPAHISSYLLLSEDKILLTYEPWMKPQNNVGQNCSIAVILLAFSLLLPLVLYMLSLAYSLYSPLAMYTPLARHTPSPAYSLYSASVYLRCWLSRCGIWSSYSCVGAVLILPSHSLFYHHCYLQYDIRK